MTGRDGGNIYKVDLPRVINLPSSVGAASKASDPLSPPPSPTRSERLLDAYRHYEDAYQSAQQVRESSLELAQARLDLAVLLLNAEGPDEPLPDVVKAQLERDARTVFARTPELDH